MTAIATFAELARAGIHLSRNGDRLHVEAKPGTITPAIRERLAANKTELLAVLESPNVICDRLLVLAAAVGMPASVVDAIPANELHLYAELDASAILYCAWLRAGHHRLRLRRPLAPLGVS